MGFPRIGGQCGGSRLSGIRLGQPIHLIGIEFSREQRTLVGFEVETLALV